MNSPRAGIGLALGSGAARGMAFIGVLKVFEREGITIDLITGTSIGALIGALYAAGVSPQEMEQVACEVDWRQMAGWVKPTLPTSGLIDGRKLSRYFAELLPVQRFEELRCPLAMTATDVETGELVVLRRGNLVEALRAALAFPGIFSPACCEGRYLVDGGLVEPVPGATARQLGASQVIGVCAIPEVEKAATSPEVSISKSAEPTGPLGKLFNVERVENIWRDLWRPNNPNGEQNGRKPPNIFRVFAQSIAIMENRINALQLEREPIDLLLRPDLRGINLFEFNRAAEAIRAGEEAAHCALPQLQQMIASKSQCDTI